MKKRLVNPHIRRTLRQDIAKILCKKMEPRALPQEPQAKKRKICFLCGPAKDRKGNEWCAKCGSCICVEHKTVLCVKYLVDEGSEDESM